MSKILVVIEGGLVQGVWTDGPQNDSVVVIDYDVDETTDDPDEAISTYPAYGWDCLDPEVRARVERALVAREEA